MRDIQRPVFPHRVFLLAAIMPMVIDIASFALGIYPGANITRLVTGAVFGIVAPFFVLPAAIEAFQQVFGSSPLLSDVHIEKGLPHA